MTPALIVAFLWLLFGGTHIGLAVVRERLVARLGEIGFSALFSAVAAVFFAALVRYYADHRFEGAAGIGLAAVPGMRWLLMAVIVLGFALSVAGLISYPQLPSALFGQTLRTPRGIERVTRHPFFAGTAVFALAHMLLATHAVGTVFFGGLALLATVGPLHQDRKILARRGSAYAGYLADTSAAPFAAMVAGRQPFIWRELPIGAFAVGAGAALAARHWHASLFAGGGWWIVGVVLAGAAIAAINAWRRARRHGPERRVLTDGVLAARPTNAGPK